MMPIAPPFFSAAPGTIGGATSWVARARIPIITEAARRAVRRGPQKQSARALDRGRGAERVIRAPASPAPLDVHHQGAFILEPVPGLHVVCPRERQGVAV